MGEIMDKHLEEMYVKTWSGSPLPLGFAMSEKWDRRFLEMAKVVASWSKDPSTQTGAVIVRPDRTIASLGYNGFAKGMKDNDVLYAKREVKYSRIIHCEMNAILSSRERLDGCTLYTYPFLTCERCAVHVIQSGIKAVVSYKCPEHLIGRWEASFAKSREYYAEAGVKFWEYEESVGGRDEPVEQTDTGIKAEPNIQAARGVGRRHGTLSDVVRELSDVTRHALDVQGGVEPHRDIGF